MMIYLSESKMFLNMDQIVSVDISEIEPPAPEAKGTATTPHVPAVYVVFASAPWVADSGDTYNQVETVYTGQDALDIHQRLSRSCCIDPSDSTTEKG